MNPSAFTLGYVLLSMCASLVSAAPDRIVYVDDDAVGANDGSSWTNAYRYLQDALADANDSQKPVEIRVAQGVYWPDRDSAHPEGTGERLVSFRLLDGVAVVGGFAGVGVSDPDARDIGRYETILSGDLAGNDAVVLDPCDLPMEPTRAENSHAVVTAGPCSRSAILDGFTIRSGNALSSGRFQTDEKGAGLLLSYYGADCCPSVRNCTFVGNGAYYGGAMYVIGARPELIHCTFVRNAAFEGGAMYTSIWRGDGWGAVSACDLVVRGCLFAGNYARDCGGALYVGPGAPFTIEGCTFAGNRASKGGAIYNAQSVSLVNCLLIHNAAAHMGGVVYSSGQRLDIISCTFSGNTAPVGWALTCFTPRMTVTNSIFWDDGDEYSEEIQIGQITGANVTYSDIRGGRINMGACGGTAEASKSYLDKP